MCSLTLSEAFDNQLTHLGGAEAPFIERNMAERAHGAGRNQAGVLDSPDTRLRRGFAEDLRDVGVRKERIGRHRVYFTGTHEDCNYTAFFVKSFKRGDDDAVDDNNPNFHAVLQNALDTNMARRIADPNEAEQEEAKPAWQKTEWFKKYGNQS